MGDVLVLSGKQPVKYEKTIKLAGFSIETLYFWMAFYYSETTIFTKIQIVKRRDVMTERLQQVLLNKGYARIQTSAREVTGFYKEINSQGYCVCVIDDRGSFLNVQGKKDYLIRQMNTFLKEKRNVPCASIGILVTNQAERTKQYAAGNEKYWMIEENCGRLIIYENQPAEFLDVRSCVEEMLYGSTVYTSRLEGAKRETLGGDEQKQIYHTTEEVQIPYGNRYYRSTDFSKKSASGVQAFHMTPVNTCLVAVNVLLFLVLEIIGNTQSGEFIYQYGGMTIESVLKEQEYWRLLACAFLHFGFSHLFSNMLVLAFVGDNLERALGGVKYLILYLLGGIGSSLLSCLWMLLNGEYNVVSAGASGAVFAVLGGMFYVLLKNHGRKDDLSAGKVGMFLLFSLLQGFTSVTTNNSAHISGLLLGVALAAVLYKRKAGEKSGIQDM